MATEKSLQLQHTGGTGSSEAPKIQKLEAKPTPKTNLKTFEISPLGCNPEFNMQDVLKSVKGIVKR